MATKCREITDICFKRHPVLKNHLALLEEIKCTFKPSDEIFIFKAPGRVNLIGEHTDYNMGPVLPCAIDKEIVFCLKKNNSGIVSARNVDKKFSEVAFPVNKPITPYAKGFWGNYIKAGIKGIIDFLAQNRRHNLTGFDAIASGNIPLAAGLSGSSALVVVSALSFIAVNQLDIGKTELAEICARAEHFVGTAGGGMDQAASLLGQNNRFLRIEFNPFKIEPISAPQGIQLVLFHSMVEAEKSGRARQEYNRRVLECRIAVDFFTEFCRKKRVKMNPPVKFIGEISSERFEGGELELSQLIEDFLAQTPESLTKKDLYRYLNIDENGAFARYQNILRDDKFYEPADGFKIRGRFKHVYTECRRVDRVTECLRDNRIKELGKLLTESHISLSKDYEVSLKEVDRLVKIIKESGAYGARIMGAGFGGMVLALIDYNNSKELISAVQDQYYNRVKSDKKIDLIFPCQVAGGAGEL